MKRMKSVIAIALAIVTMPVWSFAELVTMGQIVHPRPIDAQSEENISVHNVNVEETSDASASHDTNYTDSQTKFDFSAIEEYYKSGGKTDNPLYVDGTNIPIKVTERGSMTETMKGATDDDEGFAFTQPISVSGDTIAQLLDTDKTEEFLNTLRDQVIDKYNETVKEVKDRIEHQGEKTEEALEVLYKVYDNGTRKQDMQDKLTSAVQNMYDSLKTWGENINVSVQAAKASDVRNRWLALKAKMIQEAEAANEELQRTNSILSFYGVNNSQIVKNQYLLDKMQDDSIPQFTFDGGGKKYTTTLVPTDCLIDNIILFTDEPTGSSLPGNIKTSSNATPSVAASYIQQAAIDKIMASDISQLGENSYALTDSRNAPVRHVMTWSEWSSASAEQRKNLPEDMKNHFMVCEMVNAILIKQTNGSAEMERARQKAVETFGEEAGAYFDSLQTSELTDAETKFLQNNMDIVMEVAPSVPGYPALHGPGQPSELSNAYVYVEDPLNDPEGKTSFGDILADRVDSYYDNLVINTSKTDVPVLSESGYSVMGDFGDLELKGYYDREAFVEKINDLRIVYAKQGKTFDLSPDNPNRAEIDFKIMGALMETTPSSIENTDTDLLQKMGFNTEGIITVDVDLERNAYNYDSITGIEDDLKAHSSKALTAGEFNDIVARNTMYDHEGNVVSIAPVLDETRDTQYIIVVDKEQDTWAEGYKYKKQQIDLGAYKDDLLGTNTTVDTVDGLVASFEKLASEYGLETDTESAKKMALELSGSENASGIVGGMISELNQAAEKGQDVNNIIDRYQSELTAAGETIDLSPVKQLYANISEATGKSQELSNKMDELIKQAEERTADNPIKSMEQDNMSNSAVNVNALSALLYDDYYPPKQGDVYISADVSPSKSFWDDEAAVLFVFDENGDGIVDKNEEWVPGTEGHDSINEDMYSIARAHDRSIHPDTFLKSMLDGYIHRNSNNILFVWGSESLNQTPTITVTSPDSGQETSVDYTNLMPTKNTGALGWNANTMPGLAIMSDKDANGWTMHVETADDYDRIIDGTYGLYWYVDANGDTIKLRESQVERLGQYYEKKLAEKYDVPEEQMAGLIKAHIIPTDPGANGKGNVNFSFVIDERRLFESIMPKANLSRDKLRQILGIEVVKLSTLVDEFMEVPEFQVVVEETPEQEDIVEQLQEIYDDWKKDKISDEDYSELCPIIDLALDLNGTEEEKKEHDEKVKQLESKDGKTIDREEGYVKEREEQQKKEESNREDLDGDGKPDENTSGTESNKPSIETQKELIDYLISIGIDPASIPDKITIEWLKQNVDPKKYTEAFSKIDFKTTRYTQIQRSGTRVIETNSYYRTGSTYNYEISYDGGGGGSGSSSIDGFDLQIHSKVTEVVWSAPGRRKYTVEVYYTMVDMLYIDALDCVIYSRTISGDGENGLAYHQEQLSGVQKIELNTNSYVVPDEEKKNEDDIGRTSNGQGTGNGNNDGVVINKIINTLFSISGRWVNGIRNMTGISFYEINWQNYSINQSHTYRVN